MAMLPPPPRKRVCVIGGGVGGIVSCKILRERGFDVTVYEAESELGGIWRYQENPSDAAGVAPCYKSLRTNVSREMMELSDYEFNAPTLYPRHEVVYSYIADYARHFGIIDGPTEIVRLSRTVTRVEKDAVNGQWNVTTIDSMRPSDESVIFASDDEDTGSGFLYSASTSSLTSSTLGVVRNVSTESMMSMTGAPKDPSKVGRKELAPNSNVPYYSDHRPVRRKSSGAWSADITVNVENVDEPPQQEVCEVEEDLDDEVTETFDFVVVATGAYRIPQVPKIPGMEKFKGTVIHSVEYRRPQPLFVKKRVLVVGLGSSAIDIALEAKNFAKEVQISSRRGSWLVPRFILNQPYDHWESRASHYIPWFVRDLFLRYFSTYAPKGHPNQMRGLKFSRMTPDAGLAVCLESGQISVSDAIERFSANGVYFADGTNFRCDVVCLCTGFQRSYDYFDESVLPETQQNRPPLFQHVFLPGQDGLAFVGACKVVGSVLPIVEMQARWVAHVFAGDCKLPPENIMRNFVQKHIERMKSKGSEDPLYVRDRIGYMDSLAAQFGAKPRLWCYNRLHLLPTLLFGAAESWHYRLDGPYNFNELTCPKCDRKRVEDSTSPAKTNSDSSLGSSAGSWTNLSTDEILSTTAHAMQSTGDLEGEPLMFMAHHTQDSQTSTPKQQTSAPSSTGASMTDLPALNTLRRRHTLPGCDHLHRLDRGQQIFFFEARTDYWNRQVVFVCKTAVLSGIAIWVLSANRQRIWRLAKSVIHLFLHDFLEIKY